MKLEILTPDKILYSADVEKVTIPGTKGRFTVLKGHASVVSSITVGKTVYSDSEGKEQSIDTGIGIVSVNDNKIKIYLY